MSDSYGGYRTRLVETLREQGFKNISVLAAFAAIPRHLFVPEALRTQAYSDSSLPIGNGQTISQPSTHAKYLDALNLSPADRVLEVGTGSGYQTALLSFLCEHVTSIERVHDLALAAKRALREAGRNNVSIVEGDGTLGWRPMAPYSAIVVTAAGPQIPEPLIGQLSEGGRLIVPVETDGKQTLCKITKTNGELVQSDLGPVQFVPLLGRHGFNVSGQ